MSVTFMLVFRLGALLCHCVALKSTFGCKVTKKRVQNKKNSFFFYAEME